MTIGVDIRVLARGTRTGIEEYTLNLLEYLLPANPSVEWKLFYNAFHKTKLDYPWLKLPNVRLYPFNWPNRFLFDPLAFFLNAPKIDKLIGGADCFFSPHFLLTPLTEQCPRVVVFHDLSFVYRSDFFPADKKFWHFSMKPASQAREAAKIIAVSESTKKDLEDLYKIGEDRIKVVYPGVKKSGKITGEREKEKIRKKYNLPGKFILYFGTIEPRKNLVNLIKAFELLKKERKFSDYRLVIAGAKGWLYGDIFKAARKSPFREEIIFTGFVELEDKLSLYSLADLFVYASFFEGFGFPPLEAMAGGAPVIVSHTASLPEAAGDAALAVDPYDIEELARAMENVLSDVNLRHLLINKGLKRAEKFSWERCAEETLGVLVSATERKINRSVH